MAKLAINGGDPVRTRPFPPWPQADETELAGLKKVLQAGQWGTLGRQALAFADEFAAYTGVKYGISVNNGTVSLELILRGLDIGYGDEVIVPAYTFISTASAVALAGATPVFADIDSSSYNLDPASVAGCITPRTKAIIAVHVGGRPCAMDKLLALAGEHGLYLVEDCAQAHGSEWQGRRLGSLGHAGSFSFQASKNVSSGEGGAIVTDDYELFQSFWHYHNSGRAYEQAGEFGGLILMGTNARLPEWQAAVLSAQLPRLDGQIKKRMANASYLSEKLGRFPCIELLAEDGSITRNSYHLYIAKYKGDGLLKSSRDWFIKALQAEGIPVSSGYVPLYRMAAFQTDNFKKSTGSTIDYAGLYLENTEKACQDEAFWLPGSVLLGTKEDMDDIVQAVAKLVDAAGLTREA